MTESSQRPPLPEPTLTYVLHGNLYLNLTHRCTLRCAFCPKFQGNRVVQGFDLRLPREPTAAALIAAAGDPAVYPEVVFCGLGEPTLRLEILLTVAHALRAQGARHVRLNTDGLANLIHGRDVTPALATVIDSLSISLTAQDEATYNRHTRPKRPEAFSAMLAFARAALAQRMAVTMTAIHGLPGVDIAACERVATELGARFRPRELDVVG